MLGRDPDEGDAHPDGWDELERAHGRLAGGVRAWFGAVVTEANRAAVPFHAHDRRTDRRYHIYRGLLAVCATFDDTDDLDAVVRGLAAHVIGDVALFPSVTVGHVVGSMGAHDAEVFADYCAALRRRPHGRRLLGRPDAAPRPRLTNPTQAPRRSTMPFNDPGTGGDRLPLDDLLGALLLIDVHEQMGEMQTAFGPATPIRADVFVLDGPSKGGEYRDALVFPRKLQGQLRSSIGAQVIGRLGRGQAKAGQSPPWELSPASDADKQIGERFLAYSQARMTTVEDPF